jgi:hypothetical protein
MLTSTLNGKIWEADIAKKRASALFAKKRINEQFLSTKLS